MMTQQTQQQIRACFPYISQSPPISTQLNNQCSQATVGLSIEKDSHKKRNIKINCNKFPKDFFADKKTRCGSIQTHRDRNSNLKLHIGKFNHDLNQGFKQISTNNYNSCQKSKQYRAQSFDRDRISTRQSSLKKFYSNIMQKQQTEPLKKKQVKLEHQLLFKEDSQMFNCTFAKSFKTKESKKLQHKNHQENKVRTLKQKKNMLKPTEATQSMQSIEGLSFNTVQLNMLVRKKLVSETQFLYTNSKHQVGRLAMLPPICSGRAAY